MSQLWKYDTFPDTDSNVSSCALLYVCEGSAPISACFVVTSISLSQREYHSKSLGLIVRVCVYAIVSVSARTQGRKTDAHIASRLYKLFRCAQSSPYYKTKRY